MTYFGLHKLIFIQTILFILSSTLKFLISPLLMSPSVIEPINFLFLSITKHIFNSVLSNEFIASLSVFSRVKNDCLILDLGIHLNIFC